MRFMFKLLLLAMAVGGGIMAMRSFGSKMAAKWEEMFENAPDDFPPKWMFLNISAIREQTEAVRHQNEKILKLLEERA